MNFKRLGTVGAVAVVGTMLLASCAANEAPSGNTEEGGSTLSGEIVGIGASSQGTAQEQWISAFQIANDGVTVSYDPAGSGGGREAFISGGADFAGSDRALNDEEVAAGGFGACAPDSAAFNLPVYVSPIAIIFNIEGVDELNLDAATAAGIFKGDITSWDDPAIAALNPDATLPSAPIAAVHRSDDSGTTENFAEYLIANASDVWDAEADGNWPYEGGEGASGTSGVVDAVTNGTNIIGYADASRAGDLGVAKIQVGEEFVEYTPEAAAAIVDASPVAEGRDENDIAIDVDRTLTEGGVYPIVLVSYLIACAEYEDAETAELVKAYLGYVASEEGQQLAADEAGSAPISSDLSARVATAIEAIQ